MRLGCGAVQVMGMRGSQDRKREKEENGGKAKEAGEEFNTELARKGKWPRSTQ